MRRHSLDICTISRIKAFLMSAAAVILNGRKGGWIVPEPCLWRPACRAQESIICRPRICNVVVVVGVMALILVLVLTGCSWHNQVIFSGGPSMTPTDTPAWSLGIATDGRELHMRARADIGWLWTQFKELCIQGFRGSGDRGSGQRGDS